MPLDPQAEQFLAAVAAANTPPLHALSVADARAQMTPSPPPLVEAASIEDREITGKAGKIPIRIYTPKLSCGDRPRGGLVYFHGGGWVLGALDPYDGLCSTLAGLTGQLVISVDYRLAPEHRFPAAIDDAYAATAWTIRRAVELRIPPGRVGVMGDSAGGNLAAAVCLKARDLAEPQPAFQVLVYPITNYAFDTASYEENAEGYFLTRDTMRWFWSQYLSRPTDGDSPYASPLRAADLSGLPPALVLTAEYDPLRDEGIAYAERLAEAGVATEHLACAGMIHSFLRRTDTFDRAGQVLREIAEWCRRTVDTP